MRLKVFFLGIVCFFCACDRDEFRPTSPTFRTPHIRGKRTPGRFEAVCSNLKECASACDEIYSDKNSAYECTKLPVTDVEYLYKTAVFLKDPITRDLKLIREEEFEVFLSVGVRPFNEYIEQYTITDAKRVLAWLAEERGISRILFAQGPKKYRNIMLNLFRSTDPLVAEEALHRSLSQGDTFYKISNDRSNAYAIYMAHNVITEDLCATNRPYTYLNLFELREACVLRVYCHHHGGGYVHAPDFKYISRIIEYDDVFDYIQEEDLDVGLNIDEDEITPKICDRVCGFIPGSCN